MTKVSLRFYCYLLLIFLVSACTKEYSCEDCLTVKISPIACQTIKINGVFEQGLNLDNTNYIELTVQIDKAGFYLFSTEKINGIIFSNQGTFQTGLQVVRLTGKGTPERGGLFTFQVNRSASCTVAIQIANSQQAGNLYYYSAIIDGISYESKALDTNGITAWGAFHTMLGPINIHAFTTVVGNKIWPPAPGYTGLMLHIGWQLQTANTTNAEIKDFLKPGTRPFADPNWIGNPPFVDGVSITWYDLNGKIWYSDISTNQSDRSFTITSCTEIPPHSNSNYEVSITAEFNCKLYDNFGNVKTLTNGKFYGFTGRY